MELLDVLRKRKPHFFRHSKVQNNNCMKAHEQRVTKTQIGKKCKMSSNRTI